MLLGPGAANQGEEGNLDQALKWTAPPYPVRMAPDTDESNP
ncbi:MULTISPECIES: hypothetical protein [Corallococcus]|nr:MULTISPECIES: hypothetical protein [Corallococcus]